MSFFLFCLQSLTILLARVEWIHDHIRIPIYSNVEEYRDLPEAKLYIDNFVVVGAKVIYERNGVEWTYVSTVNTSHVKVYSIKYRAYFPDYNLYDVHTIYFDIVDEICPSFIHIPDKQMNVNEKIPDLLDGVVVKDNYYETSKLTIKVDTSLVQTHAVGSYMITYQVTDPSLNVTTETRILKVIDPLPPVITQTKAIKLNVGSSWTWQSYLTIKDNVDAVVSVVIDDQNVSYHHVGIYFFSVTATDRSGNRRVEVFEIEIVDLEAPYLRLKSKPPAIDVFQVIDRSFLESFIVELSDNYDHLTYRDVMITHDIESSVIGTYSIYYEVKDRSLNTTKMTLSIKVADQVKPVITLIKPLDFDVFSSDPLWLEYFKFQDNFTDSDHLVYKITVSVKMHVIGKYPITVEVSDSSGNKAIYQNYVQILDQIPPSIVQRSEIMITDFQRKDIKHYFDLHDQYDPITSITLEIDDQHVNYDTVGTYEAYAIAKDQSKNQTELLFEVIVIDIVEPEIKLKQYSYTHDIGHETIDMRSFVQSCQDNYDSLSIDDVAIKHAINWHEIGRYEVVFSTSDRAMNSTEQTFVLLVDDRMPPVIQTKDIAIQVGDYFDIFMGVDISDQVGISHVSVFPEYINTDQPGSYIITYIAFDYRGNYTVHDRKITIHPNQQDIDYQSYLPVAFIFVLGCSILYILYRKR